MVQLEEKIKKMAEWLKYYDINGSLPFQKVRIDITLSREALDKLKGENKSKVINDLIIRNSTF